VRFGELIREFTEDNYGRLVDLLNTGLTKLTLGENMSGQITEVVLPADGTEIAVPHSLKEVPKYRIIVRQNGAGLVIDGTKEWTDRYIYLRLANFNAAIPSQNVNFNDYIDAVPTGIANTLTVPANTGTLTNEEVTVKVLIMRG